MTKMTKFFSLLLLAGLVGVGIIGVSIMDSHENCLFGRFDDCAGGVLAMINSHIGAFQGIFAAAAVSFSTMAFTLLLVWGKAIPGLSGPDSAFLGEYSSPEKSCASFRKKFHRWLSLHENSPSLLSARI